MNTTHITTLRTALETAYINGATASSLAYRPQFVSNNHKEGKKVLSSVEDELLACDQFQISVAFITMSGITPLLQTLKELEKKKPVIFCGDLNVAHKEIDLKNPKTNRKNAGFTDEERGKFTDLLNAGFIDTFRYFYPEKEEIYSWWSYRFSARKKNAGWRIDYFCVSESLQPRLKDAVIHTEIMGSDHCPVELDIE